VFSWRRGSESNRRIKVLQTFDGLPLTPFLPVFTLFPGPVSVRFLVATERTSHTCRRILPLNHGQRRTAQVTVLGALTSMLKTSAQLRLENLALRQQLTALRRSAPKRLKLRPADRILWVWLRRVWRDWKSALMIVKAEKVVAWHRKGFRLFWTWKIRRGKPGRPSVPGEVRDLIRMMSRNNPRWGAPRIQGELLKLGVSGLFHRANGPVPGPVRISGAGARPAMRIPRDGDQRSELMSITIPK